MEMNDGLGIQGVFTVRCHDKDGNLKWERTAPNVTTNAGRKAMLERATGSVTNSGDTWRLGFYTSSHIPAVTSTMAGLVTTDGASVTTLGNRGSITWSAATSADPSVATFTAIEFTATDVFNAAGAFLLLGGSATPSDATGTLCAVAAFTEGAASGVLNDTVTASYTLNLHSAGS